MKPVISISPSASAVKLAMNTLSPDLETPSEPARPAAKSVLKVAEFRSIVCKVVAIPASTAADSRPTTNTPSQATPLVPGGLIQVRLIPSMRQSGVRLEGAPNKLLVATTAPARSIRASLLLNASIISFSLGGTLADGVYNTLTSSPA